ncbi:MAG TPA: tetratricopeptide repeat protein [Gemmatimonadaceae bacterium]|jgi:tetratricopeptide (TPR) repeat protein|nr:tetratricopeptide repeat protein [Gemmatimonadaceae bacterium]
MGELAAVYRERVSALAARLESPTAAQERDALRGELIALGKGLEQDIAALALLKDEAKGLVEKWKGLQATSAPAFSAERPVVADHIGASTFIEKGWSRISLGDYSGAEESLGKALQLAPNDPQAESLLGWAQMLQEKYDDALMQFQKVLMREPGNALARINVGYICLKKGIFGEAIEHLSKAIRLDNDRKATLYAHFYLGLVYLERDMFEDAQTFFQKSLVLGPNLIEAYFELGRAFWFNGQREEALQTWRDGFAANKFNPWGKRCAEVLKTVEQGGEP